MYFAHPGKRQPVWNFNLAINLSSRLKLCGNKRFGNKNAIMLDAECKPIGIMQQRSQSGFGGGGGEGVLFPN